MFFFFFFFDFCLIDSIDGIIFSCTNVSRLNLQLDFFVETLRLTSRERNLNIIHSVAIESIIVSKVLE